jgi:hypothetical protein
VNCRRSVGALGPTADGGVLALTAVLNTLVTFLLERGIDPPIRRIKVFEIKHDASVDDKWRIHLRQNELYSPEEFEQRFEAIVTSRLSWVNVSCYGVKSGFLLVGVETPLRSNASAKPTSLNFAGPPTTVTNNGWSSDSVVAID